VQRREFLGYPNIVEKAESGMSEFEAAFSQHCKSRPIIRDAAYSNQVLQC
jgi:hypothetical protein